MGHTLFMSNPFIGALNFSLSLSTHSCLSLTAYHCLVFFSSATISVFLHFSFFKTICQVTFYISFFSLSLHIWNVHMLVLFFQWLPSKFIIHLNDPNNHNSVITYLEPDSLECKVKWALGSITRNKASAGDGIPVELFQILKDDAVKVLQSICQQIWKIPQWPQDWKMSVFIPVPEKGNAKECSNYCTMHLCP